MLKVVREHRSQLQQCQSPTEQLRVFLNTSEKLESTWTK